VASHREHRRHRILSLVVVFCNLALCGAAQGRCAAPPADLEALGDEALAALARRPLGCGGRLEVSLALAERAAAAQNPGAEALALAWARAGLRERDQWALLGLREAQARRAGGDQGGARAVLRELWAALEAPAAWSSPPHQIGARHEALLGLWALARGPEDVPPLPEQHRHLVDLLGRQMGARAEALRGLWAQVGWWSLARDEALLEHARQLHRPRRKRDRPTDNGALPCAPRHRPLARLLEAERALTLAALEPAAGLAAVREVLARPGPWAPGARARLAAEGARLAIWGGDRALAEALADEAPPHERAWLRALAALRAQDWRGATPWLEEAARAPGGPARERPLALSAIHPQARARYWLARAAWAQRDPAAALAALDALEARFPGDYYAILGATARRTWGLPQAAPPAATASAGELPALLEQARYGAPSEGLLARLVAATRAAQGEPAAMERRRQGYFPFDPGTYEIEALSPPLSRPDPTPWLEAARGATQGGPLSPLLVLALMAQESGFDPTRCSASGACGLTQIKLAVAQEIARRRGVAVPSDRAALLDPARNLPLGVWALEELHARSPGDWLRLLASYNAGPGAVRRWEAALPPGLGGDLFLELIPEPRARAYVIGIIVRYGFYSAWLGRGEAPQVPL
jgi:soluble lytic murein transglycosylase